MEAALESVAGFSEVIVADGFSTDGTRSIAERWGCKVVDQDRAYLDSSGRLVDFSGPRNQLLALTTQPWVLTLDSDEVLSAELSAHVGEVCSMGGLHDTYSVNARYTVGGRVIECASSYPFMLPRLFRASTMQPWSGAVDEVVRSESNAGELQGHLIIPLPPVRRSLRKWVRYARLEAADIRTLSPDDRSKKLAFFKSSVRWFISRWRASRRCCSGRRLPVGYELGRLMYFVARYASSRLVSMRLPAAVRRGQGTAGGQ